MSSPKASPPPLSRPAGEGGTAGERRRWGEGNTASAMVRAIFRSVPMGDRPALFAKIHYPALYSGAPAEKNFGLLPPDRARGPCPVAILMPGVNLAPEGYAWLATEFVEAGFVAVSYGWILEEMPGLTSLTPGLDLDALKPGAYGTRPSATALGALLADLAAVNASGTLAGMLDLSRVLLGGHSAGGSVALCNADPRWFPGLRANFAYAAHSKASTLLGYDADALLPLPSRLPTLVLGGDRDGCIAASAFRYGIDDGGTPDPVGPVARTFHEGLACARGDCYLGIVAGGNHFSLAHPADPATGRPFLDWAPTRPEAEIRGDLARLITLFARAHVLDDAAARGTLHTMLDDRSRLTQSAVR